MLHLDRLDLFLTSNLDKDLETKAIILVPPVGKSILLQQCHTWQVSIAVEELVALRIMVNVATAHGEEVGSFVLQSVIPAEIGILLQPLEVGLLNFLGILLALLTSIVIVCIPRLDLALHQRLIELDNLECDIELLLLFHYHTTIWL